MYRCSTCNAPSNEQSETCTFCGTVTAHGLALRAERARAQEESAKQKRALEQEQQRRELLAASAAKGRALQEINASIGRSVLLSTVGLFMCCLPVGPIIGLLMAKGARARAAALSPADPGKGFVALVIAIVCLVASLAAWSGLGLMFKAEAERKAELRAVIAKDPANPQLGIATACALTELELLNSSYERYNHLNNDFVCGGKLEQDGELARLTGSHFIREQKHVDVVACFEHGQVWSVKQVRADDDCTAPPPLSEKRK